MDREKFEELYKNSLEKSNIQRRSLRQLKPAKNNIGFYICSSINSVKELVFIITCLDVRFNRIYVYVNKSKFSAEELVIAQKSFDLFSDIVSVELFDYELSDSIYINKLEQHIRDNIFILDENHKYEKLSPISDYVTCLSYNQYMNKRIYKNSAFIYPIRNEVNTDNTKLNGPSIVNPLTTDYFIPADLLFGIQFNIKPSYMSLEAFLNYFFVISNIQIGYITENFNLNTYNSGRIDSELNKFFIEQPSMLARWKEVFPEYSTDNQNADLYLKYIDLTFLNSSNPHITVENINNVVNIMPNVFYNCTIFDNIDQIKYPENNIWSHRAHIIHNEYIKTGYNNNDQVFKRVSLFNKNKPYGLDLYEQTIQYLIANTKAEILMVVGDKILLTKGLTFDLNNIWSGSCVNGIRTGYIDIFNIKMMKSSGIKFTDFDSFIKQIIEQKIPYSTINPIEFGMTLPFDFEKYNGVLFRIAGTKEQIVYNYFIDNYNYYFKSYENNNRYSQL